MLQPHSQKSSLICPSCLHVLFKNISLLFFTMKTCYLQACSTQTYKVESTSYILSDVNSRKTSQRIIGLWVSVVDGEEVQYRIITPGKGRNWFNAACGWWWSDGKEKRNVSIVHLQQIYLFSLLCESTSWVVQKRLPNGTFLIGHLNLN